MNRIFAPLKETHPLVTDPAQSCGICHKPFYAAQRVMLLSAQAEMASTVEAAVVHASCALRGVKTRCGTICRIKDGDGSPFPVEMEDGGQRTFAECGIEGR